MTNLVYLEGQLIMSVLGIISDIHKNKPRFREWEQEQNDLDAKRAVINEKKGILLNNLEKRKHKAK